MENLQHLPAVHSLQADERFLDKMHENEISENVLTKWIKEQIDLIRNKIINNEFPEESINKEFLTDLIFQALDNQVEFFKKNNLQSVINATGVILHTNLGRARLSKQAIKQITETAATYSTLEYNVNTGKRGSRHDLVEEYLKQLTGAEAGLVVNNNAAAVYLVLKVMAYNQEVIVSRGELIEIGGSFRISEIMEESNARLVDVGTANKTHVYDYKRAITEETALLMKVHKSNFKLIGFSDEVDTKNLLPLAEEHEIPIYEDLGSGTLFDFKNKKIGDEPTIQEKVNAGIDLISFSGDKLLGGPQAGIIVGKKEYIEKLKQHQLARVLRVDKFTLAGLEATLKSYIRGKEAQEIPTVRDIVEREEVILEKAKLFIELVSDKNLEFNFKIEEETSKIGGGTMPEVEIPTFVVQVKHNQHTSAEIAERLRNKQTPIIVRVKNDVVILDFRTIDKNELVSLAEAFKRNNTEE